MKHTLPVIILSMFFLSACSALGVATGVGATAGVSAAQEGGLSRAYSDAKIQAMINDLWFRHDVEMFRKLDMTINQGRVLLTGVVQNPEHRVEAVRLAWQPPGVQQVINEIQVADSDGIIGFARDSWITTRLRTAITFDRDVQSINYNIDTVQGTVYLIGVAQSQAELNRVVETARTIADVRQVVSYVKLAGEQEDTYDPPPAEAGAREQGYRQDIEAAPLNDDERWPTDPPQGYQSPAAQQQPAYPPPIESEPVADSEPIRWN